MEEPGGQCPQQMSLSHNEMRRPFGQELSFHWLMGENLLAMEGKMRRIAPRGGQAQRGSPSRERLDIKRKATFSHSEAGRKPTRVIITDELARGWGPNGYMPRSSPCLPRGRAEPAPPRGGRFELRWPCGEVPEMRRKVIFSEGRTPCVRKYGPDGGPKHGMITGRQATGRWPSGEMPG